MQPKHFFRVAGVAILFASLPVEAGNYTQNFNSFAVGTTNFGDGSLLFSSEPGIAKVEDAGLKELQLSQWDTTNITRAAFLLPDLDPGLVVSNFTASWVSPVYGNFPLASLGFSFSLGSLRSNDLASAAYAQERGFDTGLSFCVQTFPTTTTPGWYIRHNGAILASVTNDPVATWGNFSGTRHTFQVSWNHINGLSASQDGVLIFTNVPTPGFVPQTGDGFVWATRCGAGIAETFRIDNISVATVPGNRPIIQSASVSNVPLSPQIRISATIDTLGLDTMVYFQAGTNTSYDGGTTNYLLAASQTNVAIVLPLDTDRSVPIFTHFVASNVFGAVATNVVIQSISFERNANFTQLYSAFTWADMNDDGFLDFMVAGPNSGNNGYIYLNPGKATNTWANHLTWYGARAFISPGDFDNDNRPDLFCVSPAELGFSITFKGLNAAIVYGVPTNQVLQLGSAQQLLFFPFYLYNGRTMVRDFDHDGRQDILLTGGMEVYTGSFFTNAPDPQAVNGGASRLLRNEFPGARGSNMSPYFRMMPSNLPLLANALARDDAGFFSGGDLDADGFPDIYVAGVAGAPQQASTDWELFRGDGEMGLVSVAMGNRGINNYWLGASASLWADFNGDGREDLLVSEGSVNYDGGFFTQVLLNDGQGHLTNSGWTLPQVAWAAIATGDIFNHGRNDIVLVGSPSLSGPKLFRILRNDGNGVFTPMDFGFPDNLISNQGSESIELADYDKDGRLDIGHSLSLGGLEVWEGGINSVAIYRNELDIPSNAPPQAPVNLLTVVGPGTVTFHWNSATDDITPTNLLTYNLRVGTNSQGSSVVSPLANVTNGWRKVSGPGNCRHVFSTLYRLPPGTYYWSVQAVDGAFAGGAWATEQTFTITEPERPLVSINKGTNSQHTLHWPARFTTNYTLQQSPSVDATNWAGVTNTPFYDDGKISVAVTNNVPARFFRLSKP
jgi:hypothetical protein